ncbi:hypothetical protein AcW1_005398 [Taiwanofungus camphoratus]|nr:hypothetical protein AcW2_004166 [Antrodia cinnamomea]KAI0933616.1 hypothetical protein AcV5_005717 [Antrodia cinnamomea]KAI0948592.1 hypothetical protein AcV7_009289 [Antrodia cinnamomea]KAI0956805.1 hypothetical protein AcW1_005398 [Antrodia cinnamomea]
MTVSLQKAELIGVILESLTYGAYFIIFAQCSSAIRSFQQNWESLWRSGSSTRSSVEPIKTDVFLERHTRPSRGLYLPLTAALLFILITMHLVVDIVRVVDAFTGNELNPLNPALYYGDLRAFASVFKTVIYTSVTVVSDAFIVYRTFIVWDRSYVLIALPFLLFLADTAMGYTAASTLTHITPDQAFYAKQLSRRTQAFYSLTVSLNVLCTLFIAFKIWRIQRERGANWDMKSTFSRVTVIAIESCAVYSAFLFVLIGTYAGDSPAMFIILDMMSPIIGIVFSSVIIRVGKGVSHGDETSQLPYDLRNVSNPRQETPVDHDTGSMRKSLTEASHV